MNPILTEFHSQLDDIKKLIDFFELEKKLIQDFDSPSSISEKVLLEISNKLKEFRLSKLKFNYNSIIISLYGAFERFIESTIIDYVEKLNQIIEEYNKLPKIITKQHLILSLTLLNKIEQPKYSGPLTKESIIKNLHTCINTIENYQLNKEAFAQHTANFRTQVIDENFHQIGVDELSKKIIRSNSFKKHLIEIKGFDEKSPELISLNNLSPINELAELRNLVAHGINNEIIENKTLLEYLHFYKCYSASLIEIITNLLLHKEIENCGLKLGTITNVYKGGTVICFFTNGQTLHKGQNIIGKNSKTIISAIIKSIEINDKEVDFVTGPDKEIGIKINKKFKGNFELYLNKIDDK